MRLPLQRYARIETTVPHVDTIAGCNYSGHPLRASDKLFPMLCYTSVSHFFYLIEHRRILIAEKIADEHALGV